MSSLDWDGLMGLIYIIFYCYLFMGNLATHFGCCLMLNVNFVLGEHFLAEDKMLKCPAVIGSTWNAGVGGAGW